MGIVETIGVLVTLLTCVPVVLQMRRHPKGLHVLFFAEMWERFSYYGMRGLLIFYLTQHFLFDDRFAQSQYGAYTSLVYLLPLIGGFLADKYLGTRKAIAFGALLLVAGHFLMGAEGAPARQILRYTAAADGEEARYAFIVKGRGNDRAVLIRNGDRFCLFGSADDARAYNEDVGAGEPVTCTLRAVGDGALVLEGLAGAPPIPTRLEDGDYEIVVDDETASEGEEAPPSALRVLVQAPTYDIAPAADADGGGFSARIGDVSCWYGRAWARSPTNATCTLRRTRDGGLVLDGYPGAPPFAARLEAGEFAVTVDDGAPDELRILSLAPSLPLTNEVVDEGRQTFVELNGEQCRVGAPTGASGPGCRLRTLEGGALLFEDLATGAPMTDGTAPSLIEKSDYELDVENRNQIFLNIFYLALALIIMGVGFLKANISSIVGQLYPQGDPRRDPGFTLYYYGINLGAFWASILCGGLGLKVGWWAGFGLAGVGMLFGYIAFVRARFLFFLSGPAQLPDDVGRPPEPRALAERVVGPLSREWLIYLGGLVGVVGVWALVRSPPREILEALNNVVTSVIGAMGLDYDDQPHVHIAILLAAGSIAVLAYLVRFMMQNLNRVETERMTLALILVAASVVFWTLFEQAGSSLNQFADRNTQLPDNGFLSVTAAQTQSFNSGYILLFAPIFSAIWAFLGRRSLDPNPALKFGFALVQVGLGFWVLVWGANYVDDAFRVPLVFLGLLYLLHTTGELCLSPVGLSMITRLSAPAVVSTMMAVWFLSSAWAQYLGGIVAQFTATETVAGQVLDPGAALARSVGVFWNLGLWAIALGIGLGAASFVLKGMAHERPGALSRPETTAHAQPDPLTPHPSGPVNRDA